MAATCPLLVFTDLDGTLLNHDTYAFDPALPALAALRAAGAGVILASSKTAAEVEQVRHDLGLNNWPAIVENGAGILGTAGAEQDQKGEYMQLRQALGNVRPDLRRWFRGFGDMSAGEVAAATGLSPKMAALARQRQFSEPGQWQGDARARDAFIAALKQNGISARIGGRFLTLSFGHTKADRMHELIARFDPRHTVALGDAPNDIEMLETAGIGIVVANPAHAPLPPLKGEATGRIRRTSLPGPAGWNAAMLGLLSELGIDGEPGADV